MIGFNSRTMKRYQFARLEAYICFILASLSRIGATDKIVISAFVVVGCVYMIQSFSIDKNEG